jgi:hypothetical protein
MQHQVFEAIVSVVWRNGQAHFQGLHLGVWDSYGVDGYDLGAGTISEDSRGRWYLNVTVKVKQVSQSNAARNILAVGRDRLASRVVASGHFDVRSSLCR